MNKKQSSNSVKTPFLICTQLFHKATLANKSYSLQIKSSSLNLPKNHFKQYYRGKCQLQVKGKTLIQQMQKIVANDKQIKSQNQIKKQLKKQKSWFDQVSISKSKNKYKQKFIKSSQICKDSQLLNFYQNNIFMSPKQHRKYYKILIKNNSLERPKTQYYPEQFITQEQLEKQRRQSYLAKKQHFYRTSKIQTSDHRNQEITVQLFEPKLKHKTRPSSGEPMKKYKMSSLMIRIQKKPILPSERIKDLQLNHIQPMNTYQNQKKVNKLQNDRSLDKIKNKMILKTYPTFYKSRRRQIQIRTSGQAINPWSDDDGRLRDINEEEINVRL